jgi:hypothetical protein
MEIRLNQLKQEHEPYNAQEDAKLQIIKEQNTHDKCRI